MSYRSLKFKPKPRIGPNFRDRPNNSSQEGNNDLINQGSNNKTETITPKNEIKAKESTSPPTPKLLETTLPILTDLNITTFSSVNNELDLSLDERITTDGPLDISVESKLAFIDEIIKEKVKPNGSEIAKDDYRSYEEAKVNKVDTNNKVATPKSSRNVSFKPKLTSVQRLNHGPKFTKSTYGKMSYEAKQQMIKKFGTLTPDHSNLTMLDLIYFNPKDNPMKRKQSENKSNNKKKEDENSFVEVLADENAVEREEEEKVDDVEEVTTPVPQLKISADGKVMIAPESLVLKKDPVIETRCLVEEDEFRMRKLTKTNPDRQKWTFEETVNFYKALNTIGSDFETMKSLFPDRSRKSLKCKFKREERMNGRLIDKMLGTQYAKFDLDKLKQELAVGVEFNNSVKNLKKKGDPQQKTLVKEIVSENGKCKDGENIEEINKEDKKKVRKKRKKPMSKMISDDFEEGEENINHNIKSSIKNLIIKKPPLRNRKRKLPQDLLTPTTSSESETEGFEQTKQPNQKNLELIKNILHLENLNSLTGTSDKFVFNTNINVGGVKYTQSLTFNPNNLDNPIDVNETIAHEEESGDVQIAEEPVENNITIPHLENRDITLSHSEENIIKDTPPHQPSCSIIPSSPTREQDET